ncbi:MAG: tripartite tricarboxylate transporter substrate binding protein [Betaproteobacteria bacterium]
MATMALKRALLLTAALAGAGIAGAQEYPTRTVRMVVSFPPGAGTDVVARLVARDLQDAFGQPVVVENRPGAAGNIASEVVAKAPADGYTLLINNSTFAANVALFKDLRFDPVKDFAPVSLLGAAPMLIAVAPNTGIDSLGALVAHIKANPGKLSWGSCGNGGPPHIIGEEFMRLHGLRITHVPYKGCIAANNDLAAGHLPIAFTSYAGTQPHIAGGRMKPLAVALERRSTLAPSIPTVAELGFGNIVADLWYGVVVPAGTPQPVIARLNAEIVRSLNRPENQDRLKAMTVEVRPSTPAEFGAYMNREIERYSKLVRQFGLRVD